MNIAKKILQTKEKIISSILKGHNDYICFGAGKCFYDFINNCCIKKNFPLPQFVCDNNERLWGKVITVFDKSIEIVSPENIKRLDINKTIIAMSATLPMGILDDLVYKYRCIYHKIISLKSLETYFFLMDNWKRVSDVYAMLEDDKSKERYEAFFNSLLAGNFFNQDLFSGNPYWNNDVIPFLNDNEVIVHAGVFDGVDIKRALEMNRNVSIYGFEPNKEMYQLVTERYKEFPNVKVYPFALGLEHRNISFISDGSSSSMQSNDYKDTAVSNAEEVEMKNIDDLFADSNVSLVALDVEGMEPMVLKGGMKIIKRDTPKIAICVYHELEHYVLLAELIKSFNDEYKFYFRQHSPVAIESVLYAIKCD